MVRRNVPVSRDLQISTDRVLYIPCVSVQIEGWFGFTALQHNIGYIAPVSVVNVRMSARAGLVGLYHLAPSNSG